MARTDCVWLNTNSPNGCLQCKKRPEQLVVSNDASSEVVWGISDVWDSNLLRIPVSVTLKLISVSHMGISFYSPWSVPTFCFFISLLAFFSELGWKEEEEHWQFLWVGWTATRCSFGKFLQWYIGIIKLRFSSFSHLTLALNNAALDA